MNPIMTIKTPPPTPPLATLLRIVPISKPPPAAPAAISPGTSLPKIVPPKPPPAMPAIEFHNVPIDDFFIKDPARLPPRAPLTKLIIKGIISILFVLLVSKYTIATNIIFNYNTLYILKT